MLIPKGTMVAVVDGTRFALFENTGLADKPKLTSHKTPALELTNFTGGKRHHVHETIKATDDRLNEDAHAAAVVDWLNHQTMTGQMGELVIVADPRTLGEMRPQYHQELKKRLRGELPLTLTVAPTGKIEKALEKALTKA